MEESTGIHTLIEVFFGAAFGAFAGILVYHYQYVRKHYTRKKK